LDEFNWNRRHREMAVLSLCPDASYSHGAAGNQLAKPVPVRATA
jgi:hypothetical protein